MKKMTIMLVATFVLLYSSMAHAAVSYWGYSGSGVMLKKILVSNDRPTGISFQILSNSHNGYKVFSSTLTESDEKNLLAAAYSAFVADIPVAFYIESSDGGIVGIVLLKQ